MRGNREPPRDLADELPEDDDAPTDRPLTWTPDDFAARALRAALLGYLTCGLLHLYAMWLILRLPFVEGDLSPAGTRKAFAALALILFPPLVVIAISWSVHL